MAELAFRGAINFETFDPLDSRSWLRLTFLMEAEERRRTQEYTTASLMRQSMVATVPRLTTESINESLEASADKLSQLLKLSYPWQHFADANRKTAEEELLEAYRQEFGAPGEERYDDMVRTFNEQLAKRRRSR